MATMVKQFQEVIDALEADEQVRVVVFDSAVDDYFLNHSISMLISPSADHETLAAAKAQVNRFGTPTATELQSSIDLFFPLLALPGAQARRAKVRDISYGVRSDFELNFGRYLPSFGWTDDEDNGA